MTEKVMQTIFGKHLQSNPPDETEVYELKISKHKSLPFNAVQPHQIEALIKVENGFFHKITDPPIFYGGKMRFNVPRPFDCFYLKGVKGFVVIWYYKPRQPKVFIKIPILDFINEMKTADRKSLTEERANEIGTPIPILILHE